MTGGGGEAVEIRYAKSGDVNIAYRVVGDGPIDLLLVPGFVSHLEVVPEEPGMARFGTRLASFSRLISFDRRGMGLSDRDAGIATLEATVDDMRAVLDAAGSKRAAIMGVSEGGAASLIFAATYPERVGALILWGAYARRVKAPDYPQGIAPEDLTDRYRQMEEGWGGPVGIELWAPSKAADPGFREWWARLLRLGASPSGTRALFQLYLDVDARHVLPVIRVPTLILHAKKDLLIPVEDARYMAERIPGAKLVEFPMRDHIIGVDPDPIADEIEQFLTGQRPIPQPDRVLATVLFTDIVDSTARASELGDRRWREVLDAHDVTVRRELGRFGGHEVHTTGDGFLATFDGPARAARSALAIRDSVRSLGIEVRAGLHTGECELRGGDVGGIAVHIGARVCAAAGPGEVLASSTVRDLTVGSGLEFSDRGAHTLKGVPGEWRLLAVGG